MTTTPTVAIGIGAAGSRMLSELAEFVSKEGEEDNFRYISIDSNESDARNLSPSTAYPIPLNVPENTQERQHHVENYQYIRDDASIGTQGSDRTRSVARYFVDNPEMYTTLRNRLERKITEFWETRSGAVEDNQVHDLHIWVLHSFGGGTGSGTFPIVATMLYRLIQSEDLNATINGLGSLPRLDGLEKDEQAPDDTQFYANAYAGLSELKKIVEHDYSEPLEIGIEAEEFDEDLVNSTLSLDQNPFEMFWLLGYDEQEESASYRKRMNEVAAVGIYYYANKTSLENFPDDQDYADKVLYGLTTAELEAPVELAKRYVELGDEISACEDITAALEDELAEHKQSRRYLDEAIDTRLDIQEVDPDLDYIHEEIVTTCQDKALSLQMYEIIPEDSTFEVETAVSELHTQLEEDLRAPELVNPVDAIQEPEVLAADGTVEQTTPSNLIRSPSKYDQNTVFDPQVLIEWFYCDQLEKHLRDELDAHQFNETVEDVWHEHARDGLEEEFGHLTDAEPERKWTNALESWLIDKWEELDERIDKITFNKIREHRLKKERNQLDEDFAKIEELYEQYQQIDDVRQKAHAKRETAKKVLKGDSDQLRSLIDEKNEAYDRIENEKRNRERTRDRLERTLTSYQDDEHNRIELKMSRLDELTSDSLESSEYITSLIRDGYIEETDCARAISTLVEGIDDPIHDDPQVFDVDVNEIGGVLAHPQNIQPPSDYDVTGLLDQTQTGDQDINDLLQELDYYDQEMIVESHQGFSVWFLQWFTPIIFENTSEFGTIDGYFRSDDEDVSAELGPSTSDEDVAMRFAYPELFSQDDQKEEKILRSFDS